MSQSALDRLLGEEAARQREFPICQRKIYFAHAAVGPLPRRVTDAMVQYLSRASEEPQDFDALVAQMAEVRKSAAQLIGARAEEIALLGPTSLGLSIIANGIDWRAGDEVVCYRDDFPANVYPWLELRPRGVEVVYLRAETPGVITPEIVGSALTKRTRLVALTSCHFLTGFRIDLDAIGRLLKERGVLFAIDGIQSLGAFPLSVEHVDFMSADSHKWLLGSETAGIVFVKSERFEQLRPTLLGGSNVLAPHDAALDEINFVPGAQRYEPGALNYAGLIGMKAAIDLVIELGPDAIAAHLLALKRAAVERLQQMGFEILPPTDGANASSITTFSHPEMDSATLLRAFEKHDVVPSLRWDRAGKSYIRISPHFYNTFDEVTRAMAVLARALGQH